MNVEKFIAVTKNGQKCCPTNATFPILKQLENDHWQLIGTGFFITNNGVFLTAKHVLRDVLDNSRKQTHPIAAFLFPTTGIYQIRPILKGFFNAEGDVAAGIITNTSHEEKKLENPFYGLSLTPMKVGGKIHTFAYPETIHNGNEIVFHGNYYAGEVKEYLPEGRDKTMLPNSCYQTTMNIRGGASGGPVFNTHGVVIGINSTGFENNDSPLSYISSIIGAFNIIIEGSSSPIHHKKTVEYMKFAI
jgi:V8-like Glu-specific endopeptidase